MILMLYEFANPVPINVAVCVVCGGVSQFTCHCVYVTVYFSVSGDCPAMPSLPPFLPFTPFPRLCSSMQGPEPDYDKITTGYKTFTSSQPFYLKYNKGVLPELHVAYETWGQLNHDRSNAVLIHAGLSASSHAKSHLVRLRCFLHVAIQTSE